MKTESNITKPNLNYNKLMSHLLLLPLSEPPLLVSLRVPLCVTHLLIFTFVFRHLKDALSRNG